MLASLAQRRTFKHSQVSKKDSLQWPNRFRMLQHLWNNISWAEKINEFKNTLITVTVTQISDLESNKAVDSQSGPTMVPWGNWWVFCQNSVHKSFVVFKWLGHYIVKYTSIVSLHWIHLTKGSYNSIKVYQNLSEFTMHAQPQRVLEGTGTLSNQSKTA